jgi:hypothetical protein
MLHPHHLRDLALDAASHPRGQPHLSSASGLVQAGRWLYVIADDEHHIGVLDAEQPATSALRLHSFLPGDLPHDKGERKKRKPDAEALALLPPSDQHPHGALLALGSGSKPNRQQAFMLPLDGRGEVNANTAVVDLAGLYAPLRPEFPNLNIEGAFVIGDCFRLLQRGNKGDARNASIDFALEEVQQWLAGARTKAPACLRISRIELGSIDGVPYGFTDGAALPGGGWVFSAVAEDTSDSYLDGACRASAIGRVGNDGKLKRLESIANAPKVEGITMTSDGRLLMVTDSDDPETASALLCSEVG